MGRRGAQRLDHQPAWKTKPSWYLVATDDKMIPPPAPRLMSQPAGSTVVEAKGSHAIYVSKPDAVAALIAKAAPRCEIGRKVSLPTKMGAAAKAPY